MPAFAILNSVQTRTVCPAAVACSRSDCIRRNADDPAYDVVDADGHILEPLDLWNNYIDPKFRIARRASSRAITARTARHRGAHGRRQPDQHWPDRRRRRAQGIVAPIRWNTRTGSPAGSTRTPASPTWMPTASTRSSSTQPRAVSAGSMTRRSRPRSAGPTTAGSPITAKPYPERLFGVAMLPLQSVDLAIAENAFRQEGARLRGGFLRPNPYDGKMISHPDSSRSGRRRRTSTSRSASMKGVERNATVGVDRSRGAAHSTSSAIRWR